jgi:hypothetical protein
MARIALGNGRWFDPSRAEKWKEDTYWDGNNHISKATGSQWAHEELYRTPKGTWVLHTWSQRQGSTPSYEVIDQAAAHAWLIANGEADSVPASVLAEAAV